MEKLAEFKKQRKKEKTPHSTLGPRQHVVENYSTTRSRSDRNVKNDVVIELRKTSFRCMLQIITVKLYFC